MMFYIIHPPFISMICIDFNFLHTKYRAERSETMLEHRD